MCLRPVITHKFHPRITMSISLLLGIFGIFISSIVPNYYVLLMIYGVFTGLAYGLSFDTPLMLAWSYYPTNLRTRLSGVIALGFGLSIVVFIVITLKLANPDNVFPDIDIKDESITYHYYSEDIANNSPSML